MTAEARLWTYVRMLRGEPWLRRVGTNLLNGNDFEDRKQCSLGPISSSDSWLVEMGTVFVGVNKWSSA
jgi:hypothetical protein